jgi:hypothetical protein
MQAVLRIGEKVFSKGTEEAAMGAALDTIFSGLDDS